MRKLYQQAFRQIACSDTGRIEHLYNIERLLDIEQAYPQLPGKLRKRTVHIAGGIKTTDQIAAELEQAVIELRHLTKLFEQILGQALFGCIKGGEISK